MADVAGAEERILMKPRKTSIRDLAEATGLSTAAVSYALSGNGRVSSETRETVQKAAKKLGFVRDANAVRLKSGRSNLLGAIVNDVSNPFFGELLSDFETAASEQGFLTLVANSKDDPRRQSELLESLCAQGLAGLLVSPAHGTGPKDLGIVSSMGIPLLVCVRDLGDQSHDYVGFNDNRAGYLATQRLLSAGASRIAFLGGYDHTLTWLNRCAGLKSAVAEGRGRSVDVVMEPGPPTREFGAEAFKLVLEKHPDCDAFVCFNDYVALGAYISAAQVGRSIGHDVSLVGIDNIPFSESLHPQLTTVELFPRRAGRICAESIVDRVLQPRSPRQYTLIEPELVERHSVRQIID